MTARSRILKSIAGASFSRVVLIASQLITVPLLVLRWGAPLYGAWLAITALTSYLSYSAVGLAPALRSDMALNFDSKGEAGLRTTFQTGLAGLLISTSLAGVGFIFVIYCLPVGRVFHLTSLGVEESRSIAMAMAISGVFTLVYGVVAAAIAALGAFGFSQSIEAGRGMAELLLLVIMVGLLKVRPAEMAWYYPITTGCTLCMGLLTLWNRAPWLFSRLDLDFSVFKRLIRPMLGALALSFGYTGLSVQAPRLIIAATMGPTAVAIFALATMMLRIARIPIEIPAFATTVEISLAVGRKDYAAARALLAHSMKFTFWLAMTILPFVACLGSVAAIIWSGGRIHVPAPMILILCIATIAYSIGLPCQETLMALNKLALATTWLALFAVPFILVCVFLSSHFGLGGAALSIVVLEGVFGATTLTMALRSLNMPLKELFGTVRKPPVDMLLKEAKAMKSRFLTPA